MRTRDEIVEQIEALKKLEETYKDAKPGTINYLSLYSAGARRSTLEWVLGELIKNA